MIQISGFELVQRTLDRCISNPLNVAQTAGHLPDRLVRMHNGIPPGAPADPFITELATRAADWYASHGTPWVNASVHIIKGTTHSEVQLQTGPSLHSELLSRGFRSLETLAVVAAGFSAGAAVDHQIKELWSLGRPDEAMFLNAHAIAVVEHLRYEFRRHVAARLAQHDLSMLPHYSPGYDGWDLADQSILLGLIKNPGPLRLNSSSNLTPAKSTLALFGVAPGRRLNRHFNKFWDRHQQCNTPFPTPSIVPTRPHYAFSEAVLEKWGRTRLQIEQVQPGRLVARFRSDGSTCTNMGLPLAFDYTVHLTPATQGSYIIRKLDCKPSGENTGYQSTCLHLSKPDEFTTGMKDHPPFIDTPLNLALHWQPVTDPAGCLCTTASRDHKWRIVLQTLHYALHHNPIRETLHPTP